VNLSGAWELAQIAAGAAGFGVAMAWSARGGLTRALRKELDSKLPEAISAQVRTAVREEITDIVLAKLRAEMTPYSERVAKLEGQMQGVYGKLNMVQRAGDKP